MKDWDRLITIEQMEEATNSLLETAEKVGADIWQKRVKNQTPHCGFGEAGTCCRICSMGPCRITPKAPRGICGCDVHGIVARNYLTFTAGGAATHSDHGRNIMHTLYQTKEGGAYQVKARTEEEQVSLSAIGEAEVLAALRRAQPDTMSPIEAMQLLYELKQKLQ